MRRRYREFSLYLGVLEVLHKMFKTGTRSKNTEESEATSGLSKKKLFDKVSSKHLMPGLKSKACTRLYLTKAYKGEVFLVKLEDIALFEAQNIASVPLRAPGLNVLVITQLVDALLRKLGKKTLGFTETTLPEEDYILRICRYVDQNNVLDVFMAGSPKAQPLTILPQKM